MSLAPDKIQEIRRLVSEQPSALTISIARKAGVAEGEEFAGRTGLHLVGDEAVLIGAQGKARVDAWDLASRLGTVPLEIVTAITTRVPRIYRGV